MHTDSLVKTLFFEMLKFGCLPQMEDVFQRMLQISDPLALSAETGLSCEVAFTD